jgi:spore coat protein A, manganese oxidase
MGVGATETWEFYNTTADAHPMHIHEVVFQVVDRQAIQIDEEAAEGEAAEGEEEKPKTVVAIIPGTTRPPELWENGWKDTVIAYPGEVTRVRMTFEVAGQYVWHCHIVSHEDNEMMRPYRIGPEHAGPTMVMQSTVADASAESTEQAEQSNKVYMPLVSND